MSLQANIVLWSVSLFLATFAIIFGVIASYNSAKANKAIKTIIADSWIVDKAQRLFYKNLKFILFENKKLIKKLQNNLSYYDYYISTTKARLAFMPSPVTKLLKKSQYKELTIKYLEYKYLLDQEFKEIIDDYEILKTDAIISQIIAKKLIEYHQQVIIICLDIVKKYLVISTNKS